MTAFFKFFKKKELHIMTFLSIATSIMGYIAYRTENFSISDSLYQTLELFKLKTHEIRGSNALLEAAKWMAAFVVAKTILNLILIYIKDQLDELVIKYFYKDHIIICGLSWKVEGLIKDKSQIFKRNKIVIIEKNKDHENISEYKFQRNIKVIIGDADDDEILKRVNIWKASYVFAFTENDQTNLSITEHIQKIYENSAKYNRKRSDPLKVRIHLKDYFNLLAFKEFHKNSAGKIDCHAFNLFQQAAEKVVDEFSPDQFLQIKDEKSDQVHILISGLTIQGEYVILEAAKMYHFANLKKLKISIVDDEMSRKLASFVARFPHIEEIVDISPIDGSQFSIQEDNKAILRDVSVCFLCHNDDAESINKYMFYRQFFYTIGNTVNRPEIVSIFPQNTSIHKALLPNLENNAKELNVAIRELYTDFCKKSVLVDNKENYDGIAKNIDFIYETDQKNIELNINKFSNEYWDKKSDFEKDWNRYPARHFDIKLRAAGIQLFGSAAIDLKDIILDDATKKVLGRMEHRRWRAEKLLTGFLPGEYTGNKEFDLFLKRKLKCHPDLIDWDELLLEEQSKDYYTIDNLIFVARQSFR